MFPSFRQNTTTLSYDNGSSIENRENKNNLGGFDTYAVAIFVLLLMISILMLIVSVGQILYEKRKKVKGNE